MKIFLAFVTFCFLAVSAQAEILITVPGNKKIDSVVLAEKATVKTVGAEVSVEPLGAGMRKHALGFIKVSVYVAELFSDSPSLYDRSNASDVKNETALNSILNSSTIALKLSFVRTVDAETVQESFATALKANGVDMTEADVANFLTAVREGGEAKTGKALTMVFQKNSDGTDSLYYESNERVSQAIVGQGLTKKVLSIWLGVPADKELAALKVNLISGETK